MEVQPDFRDLLASFNAQRVEYVVVGGYALAFHGAPRFTGDLDILVATSPDNARRIMLALDEFGFTSAGLSNQDFEEADRVVQLGVPPVRVNIMTSITGVSWEEVSEGKSTGVYGDLEVSFIGRLQFVRNKKATGRKRDLADLEALGEESG
jgi:hypothetical protein